MEEGGCQGRWTGPGIGVAVECVIASGEEQGLEDQGPKFAAERRLIFVCGQGCWNETLGTIGRSVGFAGSVRRTE